ncbi:hypothetical protein CC78DRAFT_262699 [Lojkania enalia]|uniref:Uncharacterized protein n=1 Tax=Lojkania enalia TaxID=147567 RepID=A0A9P4KD42_9PLEO|nr:hypothetical protein CC78DRAFT_262699 [Didymosphaeria enalia]
MFPRPPFSFMSHYLIVLLSTCLFSRPTIAANSTCYYPSGLENKGSPCDSDSEISSCCGPGFVCLSNGLCLPGPELKQEYRYEFYRSGCTDASWNSTQCPQYCIGFGFNLNRGEGIQTCGNDQYCCNQNYDCCSRLEDIFILPAANVVTTIPYGTAASTRSTTDPPLSSASSPSIERSQQPSQPNDSSNAVSIGVGVGIWSRNLSSLSSSLYLFSFGEGAIATRRKGLGYRYHHPSTKMVH